MYYENFKKLCENKGVKPADVSKATGVATATLSSWKNGNYVPKQDKLQLIADYFNVSVDYLITGKESEAQIDVALTNMDNRIKEYALKLADMPEDKQKLVLELIEKLN